jgi:protein subunit release factor A
VDLTVHGIEQALDGGLDAIVEALRDAELRERAEALSRPSA